VNQREIRRKLNQLRNEIGKVIVGQEEVIEMLLICLFSGGHFLLEGPPGLGKTTLAKTFSKVIGGEFKRIQMTPDLLPADVLGVNIFIPFDASWSLRRGPIFANVVLVDELNRASPKVQSAFLEVMQERQVSIEGETLPLENPFMIIATQVPFGGVGTYPLTNVQIDRFAYRMVLDYPEEELEVEVLKRINDIESLSLNPVFDKEELDELTNRAHDIYVDDKVLDYLVKLVRYIRDNRNIESGPSPRASIWLLKGARVKALLESRTYVIPDDIKFLLDKAVAHRVELTQIARAEQYPLSALLEEALSSVKVPKGLE
jgi:MoxR-like ATPase